MEANKVIDRLAIVEVFLIIFAYLLDSLVSILVAGNTGIIWYPFIHIE